MKIGFLFPGQGSQIVGMGKDFYTEFESAKNVYDKVKEITGIDISKISFDGPEELLNETKYTQLAILTMSLSILKILKENNIEAQISAGLSLGEYSALIYSNVLSLEDGITIVKKRGEYMQELLPDGKWKMAAVLGLKDEEVEEVCKKVKSGFVVPVNYNCPGQIAISGEEEAVLEAQILAKEYGAKKVVVLNTYGPFHTEKLIESSKALRKELDNIKINKPTSKVIKNLDGKEYEDLDNVRDILAKHIISPVRFTETIENMLTEGVDTFIEIGPGKTLSGFVKRVKTERNIKILNINNISSLKETISYIREEENG